MIAKMGREYKNYLKKIVLLYIVLFGYAVSFLASDYAQPLTYYLYIADFAESFIQIPTSNVTDPSLTIGSSYLAGRATLYNPQGRPVGTCSATFLSMQTVDDIFCDISNYIETYDGLIVTWFTPTNLLNLEIDSIIHGMVTECITTVTTKVGFSPYFGQTFDLIVSSDDEKIYFQFIRIGIIF
ncbi:MAG: hypothetical protein ACXWL2_03070 [Candidatus Chromulinivorax sp.]